VAYVDQSVQFLRIGKALEMPGAQVDQSRFSSGLSQAATSISVWSSSSPADTTLASKAAQASSSEDLHLPGKKSKVPRPPNAFILYRAKHHPEIVQAQPELKNIEISKIIGKMWREESEAVKLEFKAMSEKIKTQHALENPGYQYAPRKPSEKKRRMTARKLAKLQTDNSVSASPSPSNSDQDLDFADFNTSTRPKEVAAFYDPTEPITLNGCLLNERSSAIPSRFRDHNSIDNMSIVLPAGYDTVEQDYNVKFDTDYQHHHASETIEMAIATGNNAIATGNDSFFGTCPDKSSISADDFINTMIDWDAFKADSTLITNTISANNEEVLPFDTPEEQAYFEEQLTRAISMME
jgi:hypothetical protein